MAVKCWKVFEACFVHEMAVYTYQGCTEWMHKAKFIIFKQKTAEIKLYKKSFQTILHEGLVDIVHSMSW